jgi:RTX calcium-binding nonapeptide repeat (4 copies)
VESGPVWARPALTSLLVLLLLGPVPAAAHEPDGNRQLSPSHFNGDGGVRTNHGADVPGETSEGQVVSDHFDGVDGAFTFRAIAGGATRYYDWYECDAVSSAYDPTTCRLLARDNTPTLTTPSPGAAPVAVFEMSMSIPPTLEGRHLVRTIACIDPIPAPEHCDDDQLRLHWDDAQTGTHPPTDSGHIVTPDHGQSVSNTGFRAVAYTSETGIGRILFCLDEGTTPLVGENASPGPGCDGGPTARDTVPDDSPGCTPVPSADCWEVVVDPPDNAVFSLGIIEQDDEGAVESGSGDCEGDTTLSGVPGEGPSSQETQNTGDDCALDKIYLTSVVPPPSPPEPSPVPAPSSSPSTTQPATCPGFGDAALNHVMGTVDGERLQGTPGPDVICALGGDDVVRGLGGDDQLLGAGGHDRLYGGPGRDTLKGAGGGDRMMGGPGRDRCRGSPRDVMTRCER